MDYLDALYADMERDGITVFDCPLKGRKAVSSADGYVGIGHMESRMEEYTVAIHERGHFLSGAFYTPYSPYQLREQCEYRADKAAALRYIPVDVLRKKLAEGLSDWELADYFNVQPEFLQRVYTIYREHLGIRLGEPDGKSG